MQVVIYGGGDQSKIIQGFEGTEGLLGCYTESDDSEVSEEVLMSPDTHVIIGLFSGSGRSMALRSMTSRGKPFSMFSGCRHESATVLGTAHNTCIIEHSVFIGSGAVVGAHCVLSTASNISHDCVLEEFCTVAPSAVLCGHVKLGTGVLVGANATILPSILVGRNAVIGAGAVVTKNVPSGMVVKGTW